VDPLESKAESDDRGRGVDVVSSMFLSVGSEPVRGVAKAGGRLYETD
jgi:hypothetical protein